MICMILVQKVIAWCRADKSILKKQSTACFPVVELGVVRAMLETCGSAGKGCTFPVIE